MADANIIEALVAVLGADPSVAALAGARVFGVELPQAEAASMPRAAVVVQPAGGVSFARGSYIEHDTQRIDLFAYGATPFEANTLRATCRRVLKAVRRQVVGGVLIHWAEPAGGFSAGRDADADWPRAFQPFQIFHALKEVS